MSHNQCASTGAISMYFVPAVVTDALFFCRSFPGVKSPLLQAMQVPSCPASCQPARHGHASPLLQPITPGPTASTIVPTSCPGTRGNEIPETDLLCGPSLL